MVFGESDYTNPSCRLINHHQRSTAPSYKTKLIQILETAIARKELPPELDIKIAVVMFIGSIQGLVMQALIAGDVSLIRRDAAGVFAIYLRGIGNKK